VRWCCWWRCWCCLASVYDKVLVLVLLLVALVMLWRPPTRRLCLCVL
jgi:hypothetical protein